MGPEDVSEDKKDATQVYVMGDERLERGRKQKAGFETSAIVRNYLHYEDGTLELFLELIKKYWK
ncbi:MAG: hypothetical protein J3Q66DRAFT_439627 [Benniella sp.]|nr:MAG: hypothetical protein J3Q66DRAFT_439627 [Benniella sp.]